MLLKISIIGAKLFVILMAAAKFAFAGAQGNCNDEVFFNENRIACFDSASEALRSVDGASSSKLFNERAKYAFSRSEIKYRYAPKYPNAILEGYLNFFHSWTEEERDPEFGLISFLYAYKVPENKAVFFLKPVWEIRDENVVFTNLPHSSSKKSVLISLETLSNEYITACKSDLFGQKVFPNPPYFAKLYDDSRRTLIESGASSSQLEEFLMRCEFELEGIFIESQDGEAPIFRITNVLSFKKQENFLEQIWSEVKQPHETQER